MYSYAVRHSRKASCGEKMPFHVDKFPISEHLNELSALIPISERDNPPFIPTVSNPISSKFPRNSKESEELLL
jgi:hypothetical protein